MRWYIEALALLRRDRELRRLALRPMGASLLVFGAVFALCWWGLAGLTTGLLEGLGTASGPLGAVIAFVAVVALSGVLFLAVASLVGSVYWNRLSRATESRVVGSVPPDPPGSVQAWDTLLRLILTLCFALLSLCVGLLAPVIGPVLIAGYVATLDATGGSFLRRGIGLGGQTWRALRLPGAFTFLLIAGTLSLVPVVNVVLLPLTIMAGSAMAARGLGPKALDKPPHVAGSI